MLYYTQLLFYVLWYFPIRLLFSKTRVEVSQQFHPGPGPCILALNHGSKIDPALLLLLPHQVVFKIIPLKFLTAEYYYKKLWLRIIMKPLGAISLKKFAWTYEELFSESVNTLNSNCNLLIFPEGKVVKPEAKSKGKPGLGYLSTRSKAVILPIRIVGSDKINLRRLLFRQNQLVIKIGETIKPNNSTNYQKISDQVMQRVYSL